MARAAPGVRRRGHHVAHKAKTLRDAVLQITFADVSTSLDNVLAVSGAAHDHIFVMAAGLVLAVTMAFGSNAIVPLLRRWRWLNYAGLALIAFVAVKMFVEGSGASHALRAALLP